MKKIAVLPGEGIGPEIIAEAVKALRKISKKYSVEFSFENGKIGTSNAKPEEKGLPDETIQLCQNSDAILFGAISAPECLLKLRKTLNLFANIRPVINYEGDYGNSPIKSEVRKGSDFVIVRELTGGIYFGKPRGRSEDGKTAFDTCVYSESEIERISEVAFKIAQGRRNKVTVVDKANVLETSVFWREVTEKIAKKYPKTEVQYMYVDNAAMQIIKNPQQFDVILTENLFGDILSDEASVITGSLGLMPSASIGSAVGLYEPIHGSYPEATGKNIANPIATILSAAMLLEYSFSMKEEAKAIEKATNKTLEDGWGTEDLNPKHVLSTSELGDKIAENIQ